VLRARLLGPLIGGLCALAAAAGGARAEAGNDPLGSPVWSALSAKYLTGGGVIVHDARIKVVVPSVVEDQAQVPVTADARGVPNVVSLVVLADLNPIQHVLTLTPTKAEPYISFRLKVEQGTPVRAAALTSDGVWHVGSTFLEAAGGGCSAPAMARKDTDWSSTVGNTQGRVWRDVDGTARLRIRVRHPMDTGLAKDNTPAFHIERIEMKDTSGHGLATLDVFEPVGEDPTMTLLLRLPASEGALDLQARDNNGGLFRSRVPAPWKSSALTPPPVERP
jgi:sulfur-oxidizing protein SoxY